MTAKRKSPRKKKPKVVKAWAIVDSTNPANIYKHQADVGYRYVGFSTERGCQEWMCRTAKWNPKWKPMRVTITVSP